MALLFETYYPGTVAIVAPAILTTNLIHALANGALDAYAAKDFKKFQPAYYLKLLRAHMRKI